MWLYGVYNLFYPHTDYGIIIPPTCDSNGLIVEIAFIEKDGFYLRQRKEESHFDKENEKLILLFKEHSLAKFQKQFFGLMKRYTTHGIRETKKMQTQKILANPNFDQFSTQGITNI